MAKSRSRIGISQFEGRAVKRLLAKGTFLKDDRAGKKPASVRIELDRRAAHAAVDSEQHRERRQWLDESTDPAWRYPISPGQVGNRRFCGLCALSLRTSHHRASRHAARPRNLLWPHVCSRCYGNVRPWLVTATGGGYLCLQHAPRAADALCLIRYPLKFLPSISEPIRV